MNPRSLLAVIALLFGGTLCADAVTSPASTKVRIFEMRASLNSDCTNPVTVFTTPSPTEVDLVSNPTFGSGSIPNGVYHCLMFRIDDMITVVPQANDGACTAGVPVTMDVFSDPANDVSITPEGVTINATPNAENDPWVYFSDSSLSSTSNNCFEPNTSGCACSGPCSLTPLTLNSDRAFQLVINLDNRIDGSSGNCKLLLPPAMPQTTMSIR